MEIIRPYGAEDNDINKEQAKILEHYTKKQGEAIEVMQIYEVGVYVITDKGNAYTMNKAEGCRLGTSYAQRNFFYMNKIENGKRRRIKKEEW